MAERAAKAAELSRRAVAAALASVTGKDSSDSDDDALPPYDPEIAAAAVAAVAAREKARPPSPDDDEEDDLGAASSSSSGSSSSDSDSEDDDTEDEEEEPAAKAKTAPKPLRRRVGGKGKAKAKAGGAGVGAPVDDKPDEDDKDDKPDATLPSKPVIHPFFAKLAAACQTARGMFKPATITLFDHQKERLSMVLQDLLLADLTDFAATLQLDFSSTGVGKTLNAVTLCAAASLMLWGKPLRVGDTGKLTTGLNRDDGLLTVFVAPASTLLQHRANLSRQIVLGSIYVLAGTAGNPANRKRTMTQVLDAVSRDRSHHLVLFSPEMLVCLLRSVIGIRFLTRANVLVLDEMDSFRNRDSARTKQLAKFAAHRHATAVANGTIAITIGMSATPVHRDLNDVANVVAAASGFTSLTIGEIARRRAAGRIVQYGLHNTGREPPPMHTRSIVFPVDPELVVHLMAITCDFADLFRRAKRLNRPGATAADRERAHRYVIAALNEINMYQLAVLLPRAFLNRVRAKLETNPDWLDGGEEDDGDDAVGGYAGARKQVSAHVVELLSDSDSETSEEEEGGAGAGAGAKAKVTKKRRRRVLSDDEDDDEEEDGGDGAGHRKRRETSKGKGKGKGKAKKKSMRGKSIQPYGLHPSNLREVYTEMLRTPVSGLRGSALMTQAVKLINDNPDRSAILFLFHASAIPDIHEYLRTPGVINRPVTFVFIHGGVPGDDRLKAQNALNTNPPGSTILITTLATGGIGLDLTGARLSRTEGQRRAVG